MSMGEREEHVNGYRWDIDFDCKRANTEYLFSTSEAVVPLNIYCVCVAKRQVHSPFGRFNFFRSAW